VKRRFPNVERNKVYEGGNIEVLREFPDESIDSIVTDPPYGIKFMGAKWDHEVPPPALWAELYRVLKPGGYMLVACGTRTQHRMACGIEDGGFEIRDVLSWVYATGYPKSQNVGAAIDKLLGHPRVTAYLDKRGNPVMSSPNTPEGTTWDGWQTNIKPSVEFWTLARKPFAKHPSTQRPLTVAENVLKHGVGAINLELFTKFSPKQPLLDLEADDSRWPPNLWFDGSALASSQLGQGAEFFPAVPASPDDPLIQEALRLYYVAKPSIAEKDFGLREFEPTKSPIFNFAFQQQPDKRNTHPTVKPINLMRPLVKLVTPRGGVCLDPYLGSGTTAVACKAEKVDYVGIELNPQYCAFSRARIKAENVVYDIFDYL
jgi:DNA modification methylase